MLSMNEDLSEEDLKKLLREATRAANVESFHPWGFTLVGHVLFIKQYGPGSADSLEVRNEVTFVTLGVLIESLFLIAGERNIRLSYKLGGLEATGPTPWAMVRFAHAHPNQENEIVWNTKVDLANPYMAAIETGRLMERARRLTKVAYQDLL